MTGRSEFNASIEDVDDLDAAMVRAWRAAIDDADLTADDLPATLGIDVTVDVVPNVVDDPDDEDRHPWEGPK